MVEEWLDRWASGRTGWHEEDGNAGLKSHWPTSAAVQRVLVPLCGKSADLVWLARRGHEVVGVELAEKAIHEFFAANDLAYQVQHGDPLDCYAADALPISIYCGDYFKLDGQTFDGLYDRGALVAIPPSLRPAYIEHTRKLLNPDAVRLIVTLEYDQAIVPGPPFSVMPSEMNAYWDDLVRVEEIDDLATCPPKFRAAGLQNIQEVIWLSADTGDSR